ncbi:MAG: 5-formyltetrahydrofolate cyclo-ligase [Brumimicrobium sp.]|nr:5-formyltetrahydrofolate cyclo-ligase [Brumimicrobium sp.]
MKKSELRTIFKAKREKISPEEISTLSLEIAGNLIAYFKPEGLRISVFLPILKFKEVNTYPLIEKLNALNNIICTPVSDLTNGTMKHVVFEKESEIRNNRWGIPEPVDGPELLPEQIDMVIVPLLTVDTKGNRVGYGKGYYDRFLSACSPTTRFVGLYLFEELSSEIEDVEETDIPLDFVVTPFKVVECR